MARPAPRHTARYPSFVPLPDQLPAGGVLLVDLGQLLFTVDIRLIDGLHTSAAGIAAAVTALAAAAAGAQCPAYDLLPLRTGGIFDQ